MTSHTFELRPVSTCSVCGLVRVLKVKGPLYAYSSDSDKWTTEDPGCLTKEQAEALVVDPWKKRPIVMFDVETTGLDWASDLITEVAAVAGTLEVDEDETFRVEILGAFSSLVRLPDEFRDRVRATEEITGISFEMLESKGSLTAASDLATFLNAYPDAVGAAYNAHFDQPFLNAMFLRQGLPPPSILAPSRALIDPLIWVRKFDRYVPGKGRHKLTTTALRYELIAPGDDASAHRADFDAALALKVLAHLAAKVPDDMQDLRDFQRAAEAEWAQGFFGDYLPKQRRKEHLAELRARTGEIPAC